MKKFLRDYFTFNRSERNGLIVLASIVLILFFVRKYSYLISGNEEINISGFQSQVEEFQKGLALKDSSVSAPGDTSKKEIGRAHV